MAYYSYKITRDYGFAPNPFFGFCTLACCKPHIRLKAELNDWIIGTGAKANNLLNHLIFIMKVTEKLSFEEYWSDKRFIRKRPVINGSLAQVHGDNIYYKETDIWHQLNSHHSLDNGDVNLDNLRQDLSGSYVLVSDRFIYLGKNNVEVPDKFKSLCSNIRDYYTIKDDDLALEFIGFLLNKFSLGINGDPLDWSDYSQLELIL